MEVVKKLSLWISLILGLIINKTKKMKVNINYCSIHNFGLSNIHWWVFMFKRYTYIKGFIVRILGVYINVRENNSTEKLLQIARQQNKPQ